MADNNVNTLLGKVISGIAVVILASLILWLCASAHASAIRLSVLENQFTTINTALVGLRADSNANRQLLMEIRGKLP